MVKPFNPAEVVALVQAVLRRTRASAPAVSQVLRVGEFQIDLDSHSASVQVAGQAQKLELTLTEFKLLDSVRKVVGGSGVYVL